VAGLIAPFLSHSVLWLSLGQLAFALIALMLWLIIRNLHARGIVPVPFKANTD
jgi:DHA1 family bicyclomycin/chloramphenicol resistance-like MFS transporter